jgi:hypothetical protein
MRKIVLSPPSFGFVLGTRVALAVGVGLLLADRLSDARRRAAGVALVAIGVATTIPAALWVRHGLRRSRSRQSGSIVNRDERLIGAARFPRKGDDDAA